MAIANLQTVRGISEDEAELLRAVGVEGVSALSLCEPGELLTEMEQANRHLGLVEVIPAFDELGRWVEEAREIVAESNPGEVMRLEEDSQRKPVEFFHAVPITREFIVEHQISVGEVPVMDHFYSPEELRQDPVPPREPQVSRKPGEALSVPVREITPKGTSGDDGGKLVKTEIKRKPVDPLKRAPGIDIRKTASPGLNTGKKAYSRSYIRGVLHPQPVRVKIGAWFSLLTLVLMPLTFVSAILMLTMFDVRLPGNRWLLAFPVCLLLAGIFYLLQARGVKCRVCGQPLFSPKSCRRNPKAHHAILLGYIFPTSLQLLIFHWFRCMYCGTSIRLKK